MTPGAALIAQTAIVTGFARAMGGRGPAMVIGRGTGIAAAMAAIGIVAEAGTTGAIHGAMGIGTGRVVIAMAGTVGTTAIGGTTDMGDTDGRVQDRTFPISGTVTSPATSMVPAMAMADMASVWVLGIPTMTTGTPIMGLAAQFMCTTNRITSSPRR